MKEKQYDIFISYRREGGLEMADSIYQRLVNAGYSVFLDLEQLNSGKFNTKLLRVIEQCKDFILVLPPHALKRCDESDDWVRLEVEHAIKTNKNIIPIMLRGFSWPSSEELPETLKDLPNYNGISASDHNVFVENIERLKKTFLVSKAGFTWRRYRKVLIPIIALSIVGIGITTVLNYNNRREYEVLCNELASEMMMEFAKMHYNLSVANDVQGVWEDYVVSLSTTEPDTEEQLANSIEHFRASMKEPNTVLLSDDEKNIFRKYEFPVEEIGALNMVTTMFFDEVNSHFNNILTASSSLTNLKSVNDNIKYGFEYLKLYLESDYYALLSVYALMPNTIYDKTQESITTFTSLPNVPLTLSSQEYERMQKNTMSKIEEVVLKMGGGVKNAQREVEIMEQKYDKMEAVVIDMKEKADSMMMENKLRSVDQKRIDIEKKSAEMAEMDVKLTEAYNSILKQFELLPTDDQGVMWGKILRIAKVAEIAKKSEDESERQHKELVASARKSGVDPSTITPFEYTITAKDKYENIDKWLVKYQEFNPANETWVKDYVSAARAYYKSVYARRIDAKTGIIVVATKDNEKHPAYKIGDIVVEKNGINIHSYSDYTRKTDDATTTATVLRLINGKLESVDISYPANCPVLVGLSELHEE